MMYEAPQGPITETSLAVYFREQLNEHTRKWRPPPQEDTCWYIGNLLERFTRTEQFLTWQDGQMHLRPLALIYGDALQTTSRHERCLLLQHLGDMALFVGALFPQKYAKHGILRDYFIGMGGSAYDYLAENSRRNRHVFAELAGTFAGLLTLVAEVCSRNNPVSHEDILALYQRWMETRDALAARQLRALGIELGGSEEVQ